VYISTVSKAFVVGSVLPSAMVVESASESLYAWLTHMYVSMFTSQSFSTEGCDCLGDEHRDAVNVYYDMML